LNIFSLEFLGLPLVEWIGYLASVLIALSIAMSSFLKMGFEPKIKGDDVLYFKSFK